eukprot:EG_transcript_9994
MTNRTFHGRPEPEALVSHDPTTQRRTASKPKPKATANMRNKGLGIFGPAPPSERKAISLVCIDGEVNTQLHSYKQEIADLRQQLQAMETERQRDPLAACPEPWPYMDDPGVSKEWPAPPPPLEATQRRAGEPERRLQQERDAHRQSTARLRAELDAQTQATLRAEATAEDLRRRHVDLEAQLRQRTEEVAALAAQLEEQRAAPMWAEREELLLKEIAELQQANEKLQVYAKDSSMLRALRAAETRLHDVEAVNRRLVALCEDHGLAVPHLEGLLSDQSTPEAPQTGSLPALPSIVEPPASKPRCHSADSSPSTFVYTKGSLPRNSAPGGGPAPRRPTTSQASALPVGVPPRPCTSPQVSVRNRKG